MRTRTTPPDGVGIHRQINRRPTRRNDLNGFRLSGAVARNEER